jgi:hypothetical protein
VKTARSAKVGKNLVPVGIVEHFAETAEIILRSAERREVGS